MKGSVIILNVLFLLVLCLNFYSAEDISTCRPLNVTGTYYNLTANITSTIGCFNVTVPNVILDCNGFWINYSTGGATSTYGVSSNQFNTTIKNCYIFDGNRTSTQTSRHGIYLLSNNGSIIYNNTINVSNSRGIYLNTNNYSNLTLNFITSNTLYGIYLSSSNNNNLTNNNITTISGMGIYLVSGQLNNLIGNNVITGSSIANYAAIRVDSGNNSLENNSGRSTSSTHGIYIYSSSNNNLINNNGTSSSGNGIYLQQSSNNIFNENNGTSILGNLTNTGGFFMVNSTNNNFSNNTGTTGGKTISTAGFFIQNSSNNNFSGNIGQSLNLSSLKAGIYLYSTSDNNSFINDLAIGGYGFWLLNSSGNNLTRINVSGNYAYYLRSDSNNLIQDCVQVFGSIADIYTYGSDVPSTGDVFLNCSYQLSKEKLNNVSDVLTRKWYYQAYVNYYNGTPVNSANLSFYNSSGILDYSFLTNSSGYISKISLTDYVNHGGTRYYSSNYLINASDGVLTTTHLFNSTSNQNFLSDYFLLTSDTIYPLFSNYQDDVENAIIPHTGQFNVTVYNTNGTVLLEINHQNITASNLTYGGSIYNATYLFNYSGNYSYKWYSYGNGISNLSKSTTFIFYNISEDNTVSNKNNNSICLGDINSDQWRLQYASLGYAPEVVNNQEYDSNYGYLDYVNPSSDSGNYGILTYKIVTPSNISSLNISVPMKLPNGVLSSIVGLAIYDTNFTSILSNSSFNLTNMTTIYSLNHNSLSPNTEYNILFWFNNNGDNLSSQQARALVGEIKCIPNSSSFIFNESYQRLEFGSESALNDINNELNVRYPKTSEFARYVINTNTTKLALEITSNLAAVYDSGAYISIRVNGVNYTDIYVSSRNNILIYNITLPEGDKYVEITNGMQSLQGLTPPLQGTWVRSIYFPSNSYVTENRTITLPKLVIYGDSIAGVPTTPPFHAWTVLLRNNSKFDVTTYAYGWRSLQNDYANVGVSNIVNNISKISPDYVYLAIGTNDYGLNGQNSTNFGIEYGELIDALHVALPNTVIFTQTPINRSTETANSFGNTLQDYRDQIITLSSSRSNTLLVDGTQILDTSDLSDGVHPSLEGNEKYYLYVNNFMNNSLVAPLVKIISPVFGTYTNPTISFEIETNKSSTCNYSLNSGIINLSLTANSTGTGHAALETLSNGNYVVNFYCNDLIGNKNNSATVSFSVTGSIAATTSGSPGATSKPSTASLTEGYSRNFVKNQKVEITINGEKEIITINKILENEVQFSVSGNNYSVSVNSTKKFDLNSDGVYDLQISVNKIYTNGIAQMEFKLINEKIPTGEKESAEEQTQNETPTESKNVRWIILISVFAVAIIFVLIKLLSAKKFEKKYGRKW